MISADVTASVANCAVHSGVGYSSSKGLECSGIYVGNYALYFTVDSEVPGDTVSFYY
jgi:hypothetical protein